MSRLIMTKGLPASGKTTWAKERLKKEHGDSESYHIEFDKIVEERLAELDAEFMTALNELYDKSGQYRWYA